MFGRFGKKVAERFAPVPKTVVDLDAIISETHYVRFQGETHAINPVDVRSFLVLANGWAEIQRLQSADKISLDELVNGYWGVINPVVPSITKEMIRHATNAQLSALVSYVHECVNGRADTGEKKKNLVKLPPLRSAPLNS